MLSDLVPGTVSQHALTTLCRAKPESRDLEEEKPVPESKDP